MTEPTESNGASVRITLRDVYELITEMQRELSKAVGSIETHIQQASHSGTLQELNDHEGRIRKLEKVAWMALGIGAVASVALTVILYSLSGGNV